MLHDDEVALVVVGDAEVVEECLGGLAHDHGAEELAAEPGAAAWSHAGLDDGDLEVGTLLGELVGGAQSAGTGTDDDNVGFGVVVEISKVAAGWDGQSVGTWCEGLVKSYSLRARPGSHGWGRR